MREATGVDGETREKEDGAEDGPAGVSGIGGETSGAEEGVVSTMAVGALRTDGTTAAGVLTRKGGGRRRMKKKPSMIGTGLTRGIWPMAISTEVAGVAARCTEGQAFIKGM
jgi:hypothetical protein